MPSKNPGLPEFRSTAVMLVFAVIEAERRLRDVKDQNLTAHLHAAFRKKFDESSGQRLRLRVHIGCHGEGLRRVPEPC